jgi:hypothetical protein
MKKTLKYFLCTGGVYYALYMALLISYLFRPKVCMEGGRSRAIKFLYAPERPEQGD